MGAEECWKPQAAEPRRHQEHRDTLVQEVLEVGKQRLRTLPNKGLPLLEERSAPTHEAQSGRETGKYCYDGRVFILMLHSNTHSTSRSLPISTINGRPVTKSHVLDTDADDRLRQCR